MSQYLAIKAKRAATLVDLSGHMEVCELNYYRFITMLPNLREPLAADQQRSWCFEAGDKSRIKVVIELKDSAPYTSVVEIRQQQQALPLPTMQIRLYHDASLAEVIVFDGHRHWLPQYTYPNRRMYNPDEKLELNRFFRDWLSFCRQHGLCGANVCEMVPNIHKA